MDPTLERLSQSLGSPIPAGSTEHRFNCPFCQYRTTPDISGHLYVNTIKDKYHCFRCGSGGPLERLFKYLKIAHIPKQSTPDWELTLEALLNPGEDLTDPEITNLPENVNEGPRKLPHDFTLCDDPYTYAYKYLLRRGFRPQDITRRHVGFGSGYHQGLVIFPELSHTGELLYWSSKPYDPKRKAPKNCPGGKGGYVYWLEQVPDQSFVVITEGVFDAIVFGDRGTALLGSTASTAQLQSLLNKNFQTYFLALDGDAMDKQIKLAKRLWQENMNVRILTLPRSEDPNSLGRMGVAPFFRDAVEYNPDMEMNLLLGDA